ncbi:YcdB/YcdC domain-containing protein [Candidatus Epulonipiscium viviparus]|uniref:YcdB/YcdC domain-containing protein n=1 Tax=Candidatus Epulonipiscium viviparus TaxID=420336 RepID=UPI0027380B90|nr:YcdB/YcdC domain-containing protein [Candidatus Epulopiscium viviparus]
MKKMYVLLLACLSATCVSAAPMMTEYEAITYVEDMFNLPKGYSLKKNVITPLAALPYYSFEFSANTAKINVDVEQSGSILEYNNENVPVSGPTIFSYEQCKNAAQLALNVFAADYKNDLVLVDQQFNPSENSYTFFFVKQYNGIPVLEEKISVSISMITGEVARFEGIDTYLGAYLKETNEISAEDAMAIYKENVNVGVFYKVEQNVAVPMFGVLPSGTVGVSPSSAEVIELTDAGVPADVGLRYGYEQSIIFAKRYIETVYGYTNIELLEAETRYLNGNYHLTFLRTENGLPVINNFITITISADTGVTQDHQVVWDNNIMFQNIGYLLSPAYIDNLTQAFMEASEFGLYYINISEMKRVPVYTTNSSEVFINPVNGSVLVNGAQ